MSRPSKKFSPQLLVFIPLCIVLIVAVCVILTDRPAPSPEETEEQPAEDRFYAPEPQLYTGGGIKQRFASAAGYDTEDRPAFSLWEPDTVLTGEAFGIERVTSTVDFDGDGIDDQSDILQGAHMEADLKPFYDINYYPLGYPPEGYGVCTDVIWRAFRNAGYSLKRMIDEDIEENLWDYDEIDSPDPGIDFRRVCNLHVWLERYCISLTTDTNEIDQWQPGDIVIFESDEHTAIISDRRNGFGVPYILHNGGTGVYEANTLVHPQLDILAHYRFDASKIDEDVLIPWDDEIDVVSTEILYREDQAEDIEYLGEDTDG